MEKKVTGLSDLPEPIVNHIQARLKVLEQKNGVTVLHAVESGSRAWDFASPDSDYDVRFIYTHAPDWYFSVFEERDVIEDGIVKIEGAEYDINGWDLRKALRLLYKSNPVLIEWLQSPIVYANHTKFTAGMLELARYYHQPRAAHYHYYRSASSNFREHLAGDQVKLKKYFYVIRPVLACMWVDAEMGIPPMTLVDLLDGILPTGAVREEILQLREQKMATPEFRYGPKNLVIDQFLQTELIRLSGIVRQTENVMDPEPLNRFLRDWSSIY